MSLKDGRRLMAPAVLSLALATGLLVTGCNDRDDEKLRNGGDPFKADTIGAFTLQWQVDTVQALLRMKVQAPTTGWISVGFNTMPLMQGANLIVGYVLRDTVHLRDDFGSGPQTHQADVALGGTDDITGPAGTEAGGVTELEFMIPLNSGDARDIELMPGTECRLLLAHGAAGADDFDSYHEERLTGSIRI